MDTTWNFWCLCAEGAQTQSDLFLRKKHKFPSAASFDWLAAKGGEGITPEIRSCFGHNTRKLNQDIHLPGSYGLITWHCAILNTSKGKPRCEEFIYSIEYMVS
jgi:hypothetical protein